MENQENIKHRVLLKLTENWEKKEKLSLHWQQGATKPTESLPGGICYTIPLD